MSYGDDVKVGQNNFIETPVAFQTIGYVSNLVPPIESSTNWDFFFEGGEEGRRKILALVCLEYHEKVKHGFNMGEKNLIYLAFACCPNMVHTTTLKGNITY